MASPGEEWNALSERWGVANQHAREARARVTAEFAASAQRKGPGPTVDQLKAVERLEHEADAIRLLMDEFTRKHIGR